MKKRLFALAGGIILVGTVGKIITIPAVAQTIRAAFVKNIDEKGRNPYSQSLYCTNFVGNACQVTLPDVPPGMRLVVENINLRVVGTSTLGGAEVALSNAAGSGFHHFATVYGFYAAPLQNFFLNANLTEYVDAGPGPTIGIYAVVSNGSSPGSDLQADGRITGYLVNLNN